MASAAGAISEQWNGADTGSSMARRMPRSLATSMARLTALRAPEITTWPPPLSLATSITSCRSGWPSTRRRAADAQISRACSSSTPNRGHRLLHGAAAHAKQLCRLRDPQAARGGKGGVLAE